MGSRLPATPLEVLSISRVLRFIVKTIHTCADIFGFWKYPSQKAAADFEEMTLLDKIYWGYKSKNPIVRAEKDSRIKRRRMLICEFPEGFVSKHSLTFAAVGDLIKVEGLENSKDRLYEKIAEVIFDKDISYANLESQLTRQDVKAYTFSEKETPPTCCSKEQYTALKGHFDKVYTLMHTACNHTLDMGLEGLETTLTQLENDNIMDLGTNRVPAEQHKGKIIERNGIKIGFVSATYGLNGLEVPEEKDYMVNVVKFHHHPSAGREVDLILLNNQINDCKEQGCDIIIASLHWGYEYEFFPRQHQIETAHAIVEAGVDVIISHHTHVLQPVEYYRTQRDLDKTAVIAYSLGNLTTSFSAPHLVLSGILNLTIVKGSINDEERTFVREAKLIPVVQRDFMDGDLPVIQLEKLETFTAGKEGRMTPEEKAYISAVGRYADIVLGGQIIK
jgi:hypothetical protein